MLTQFVLTNAKPRSGDYKLADGEGLYVLVKANGSKLWRLKYRFGKKEKTLSFGAFPAVTILEAREQRHEARKLLSRGIDPSEKRKEDKLSVLVAACNTFGAISEEYLAKLAAEGAAESTIDKNRWLLNDLAAPLHARPITARPANSSSSCGRSSGPAGDHRQRLPLRHRHRPGGDGPDRFAQRGAAEDPGDAPAGDHGHPAAWRPLGEPGGIRRVADLEGGDPVPCADHGAADRRCAC
jgi:hypothetical protein